ncbi:hypothetical protein HY388_00220 [Candidatus Daviesbacteria bacterium]|nr:hypothetical protein [Candidatus Daviesbacteria bacterium]
MNNLIAIISYIANRGTELKNKFTDASSAPVEFACIFCQSDEEYIRFTNSVEMLGKIVEKTQSGFTYLLDKPIDTVSGPLRLIKIRKPDPKRNERGDVDFNTDYTNFKEKYQNDPRFELVKQETFEMFRLSDPDFNVMACFSGTPKSKSLGIML